MYYLKLKILHKFIRIVSKINQMKTTDWRGKRFELKQIDK